MGGVAEIEKIILEAEELDKDVVWALLEVWKVIAADVVTADAVEESAGPEAAPVVDATTIGGAFLIVVMIPIILALVIILLLLVLTAKGIPAVPIVGAKLGSIAAYLVGKARQALEACYKLLETGASDMWKIGRGIFHLWLQFSDTASGNDMRRAKQDIAVLRSQVASMNKTQQSVESAMLAKFHSLDNWAAYINKEEARIWTELNRLHAPSVLAIQRSIATLEQRMAKLSTSVDGVEQALKSSPKIPATLVAEVRQQGQEIAKFPPEIETLRQRLQKIEHAPAVHGGLSAQQAHELGVSYHLSTVLVPLLALAPLTLARVANLRKLADDPCQCPTIGGIPNPLIALVAADFILKDGI